MGRFDDLAAFHIVRELAVTPERLWYAVSTPDEVGKWLLPVSFEPRAGAPYAFHSQPAMTGTLGEYRHRCAIRFDSSDGAFWRFGIESLRHDSEVRLKVEDRMAFESMRRFPGGATKAWNPGVTAGWHEILDALEYHLTGRQPPEVDYPRLCRFYERVLVQLATHR